MIKTTAAVILQHYNRLMACSWVGKNTEISTMVKIEKIQWSKKKVEWKGKKRENSEEQSPIPGPLQSLKSPSAQGVSNLGRLQVEGDSTRSHSSQTQLWALRESFSEAVRFHIPDIPFFFTSLSSRCSGHDSLSYSVSHFSLLLS